MMQPIQLFKEGKRRTGRNHENSFHSLVYYLFRKLLIDRLAREPEIKVLLLESVCTDTDVSI